MEEPSLVLFLLEESRPLFQMIRYRHLKISIKWFF